MSAFSGNGICCWGLIVLPSIIYSAAWCKCFQFLNLLSVLAIPRSPPYARSLKTTAVPHTGKSNVLLFHGVTPSNIFWGWKPFAFSAWNSLISFATPNIAGMRRWCELTMFSSLRCFIRIPPPLRPLSLPESPAAWYAAYGGKGGRSILVSAAQRTSLPVTAGQVSAGGEAAATQRASERASTWARVRVCVEGRNKKESPLHGSWANEPSGPAQGRAPPVDKRSILSISLSALDNKQKFSTPKSCLAFEMRIVVC